VLFQRTLFAAVETCDCGRMANDADCGRLERRPNQTLSPDSALGGRHYSRGNAYGTAMIVRKGESGNSPCRGRQAGGTSLEVRVWLSHHLTGHYLLITRGCGQDALPGQRHPSHANHRFVLSDRLLAAIVLLMGRHGRPVTVIFTVVALPALSCCSAAIISR